MEHGDRKVAVETARAATMAVHAAAGCARQFGQAVRLLRAAEALCRSATALLTMPLSSPPPAAVGPGPAALRSRRQRGRGGKKEKGLEAYAEQSSASAHLVQDAASRAGDTVVPRATPSQPCAEEEEVSQLGSRWMAVDAVGAAPAAALEPPVAARVAASPAEVPAASGASSAFAGPTAAQASSPADRPATLQQFRERLVQELGSAQVDQLDSGGLLEAVFAGGRTEQVPAGKKKKKGRGGV